MRVSDPSMMAHSFKDFAAKHRGDISEDFDLHELTKLKTVVTIDSTNYDFDMKDPIFYLHKPISKAMYKHST